MNRMWKERFEGELNKINAAIVKKGGTKHYEKVVERTGRAIERYPSIACFYDIEYVRDEQNPAQMAEVRWKIKSLTGVQRGTGVYFLRTNVPNVDGRTAWDYYNLIREIEATNRQLKTDLNLRPIYHQKDSRSDAHLFFGLLSYWVVNHHPPPTQTLRRNSLLDRDCPTHAASETCNHGGRQRARREGEVQGMQPSDEGCRGHLPSLGYATGTVHQSKNL